MRNNLRILVISALVTFLLIVGCSKPEAKRTPEQSAVAAAPQGIVEKPKAAPVPAPATGETRSAAPLQSAVPRMPLPARAAPPASVPAVTVAEEIPAPPAEVPPIAPQPERVAAAVLDNAAAPPPSVTPQASPLPEIRLVTIPAGTRVTVRTIDSVDSRTDRVGQTFLASVDSAIVIDGEIVVPGKAEAYLRLTQVSSAGELKGKSELRLQLESITAGGRSYIVESTTIERSGEPEGPNTARDVTIGAAIGAAIGAITGGGKGAAVGATAGAGAGVAIAAITKGEQVLVRSETRLDFLLERPVEIGILVVLRPAAPAISRMDNSSSGPRRLGDPVPLPRARDDKERGFNLTGEWDLTIDSPQGKRTLKLFLNQRGRNLTGSIDGPRGNSLQLRGSVEGDSIDFTTVMELANRTVREHFTGTITGDRLRGSMTIDTAPDRLPRRGGGRGPASQQRMTWTARRS